MERKIWSDRRYELGAGAILVLLYISTIPTANWMIGHLGTTCVPNGPCLIPVAPGVMAPSGVLVIGVALVLRDLVQRQFGILPSLACVAVGTVVSALIAPPSLVIASAAAFLLSELADFAVYTPLAVRRFVLAVLLSCVAGAVVDSALFLWLAFGSIEHIEGQVLGKLYAALAFILWRTVRDRVAGTEQIAN
jgi:uncharacterized PurR-regulated membrane protein YhhQ (DUF165 family)